MRAVRASMLLAAAAMLVSALHLTLALPADAAAAAVAEAPVETPTVSQRDPEEHPAPAAPAYHFPRPSEIIHAVGNYVHGAHQQHVQEQHEQHHEHVQEHVEEHHEHHHRPTTHRPVTHRPHRPLHAEKEKIKVTKTVLVEFTKLVTRHPVCLKVNGVRPPCLPFQAYSASGAHGAHADGKPCHGREEAVSPFANEEDEDGVYADAELKEGLYISPSAAAELPSATQIVDSVEDLEAAARSARYLELRPPAPPAAPAAATPALPALPAEQSGRQHLISAAANHAAAGAGGLLGHHNKPETIVEYKTLWVTKVEKVWDHRVTATLIADNCVPTDLKIPFCGAGYGPTYEAGDEIVYKPAHKPAHHETAHKPIHKPHRPIHHDKPAHPPVHHEKPVHHEPVHKPVHPPVHHEKPVHPPVHHEKPVHHEPVHKPVHPPVHHEPVHKPVHPPVHHEKPVHHEVVYKPETEKPAYGLEYNTDGPANHHWREGAEEEAANTEESVVPVENTAEEAPSSD